MCPKLGLDQSLHNDGGRWNSTERAGHPRRILLYDFEEDMKSFVLS